MYKKNYELLPKNFDWKFYKKFYDELDNSFTEKNIVEHWIKYGKNEKRFTCEKDVNKFFYLFCKNNDTEIVILTKNNFAFIGMNIKKMFEFFNIKVKLINKLNNEDIISENIFIIVNMTDYCIFPKNYIIFNIKNNETISFDKKYNKIIENSILILESSVENIKDYKKTFYQPIPYKFNNTNNNCEFKYDIIFFGKKNLIDFIKKKFGKYYVRLENINNIDDVSESIDKSKIIIYMDENPNKDDKLIILTKLLKYNKILITNIYLNNEYEKFLYSESIDFLDNENISDTIVRLIDLYINDVDLYYDKIEKIINNNIKLDKKFTFFLKKNLLSIDNLFSNNDIEYDLENNKIYCLHLLETSYRLCEFKKQKYYPKINIFPGIKYSPGWIGCALSYYNIILNAKRCKISRITICEDDCKFNDDFESKYLIINSFLDKINSDWDIFVGCIADLPFDVTINNIYKYKKMIFLEINKMHSTVFNIYNKSCYDIILKWSIENKNHHTNQIDQYLKKQNLKIIITYPFEFSCLNVKSTLWDFDTYYLYDNLFKKSLNLLCKYINNYDKNKIIVLD